MAGSYNCDNEPSGSVKWGEFLEQLRNFKFPKKDSYTMESVIRK